MRESAVEPQTQAEMWERRGEAVQYCGRWEGSLVRRLVGGWCGRDGGVARRTSTVRSQLSHASAQCWSVREASSRTAAASE